MGMRQLKILNITIIVLFILVWLAAFLHDYMVLSDPQYQPEPPKIEDNSFNSLNDNYIEPYMLLWSYLNGLAAINIRNKK